MDGWANKRSLWWVHRLCLYSLRWKSAKPSWKWYNVRVDTYPNEYTRHGCRGLYKSSTHTSFPPSFIEPSLVWLRHKTCREFMYLENMTFAAKHVLVHWLAMNSKEKHENQYNRLMVPIVALIQPGVYLVIFCIKCNYTDMFCIIQQVNIHYF